MSFLKNTFRFAATSPSPFLFKSTRRTFASSEIKIEFETPFKVHLCDSPQNFAVTNKEEMLKFYHDMYRMRRLETAADTLYKSQLIRGFCHLYSGQEAVAVGMEAALTKEDHVISAYRIHCNMLGRGGTPTEVLAELLGKEIGCAKGKGGSMHMYKRDTNFFGGNGIVGAQVPLGAGLSLALQFLGKKNISVSLYGDGAANQGQVFEAFNMASLWKLPAVFICENNHYAMGTSVPRHTPQGEYYRRGDYIPGIKIDGMNVFAVKVGVALAKEYALSKGPIVLEMDTYRYAGHSMSDPGTTYRTREEVAKMRESKDPITRLKMKIIENKVANEEELKEIEKQTRSEIEEAIKEAKNAKEPDLKELTRDIYREPTFTRGVELANSFYP